MRDCLHRIVDVGMAQPGLEPAVVTRHGGGVEHQRRALKSLGADVVFDTGGKACGFNGREAGDWGVHGHLQKNGSQGTIRLQVETLPSLHKRERYE
jgi:hypothetical protein